MILKSTACGITLWLCSPTTTDARFLPYTRSSLAHLPLGAAQHVFEVMCTEKISMIWLLFSSYVDIYDSIGTKLSNISLNAMLKVLNFKLLKQ
jgi:hypothetical protein